MAKVGVLMVVLMMLMFPSVQAGETPAAGQEAGSATAAPVQDAAVSPGESRKDKGKGGKVFWVVLVLAFLFVLGSALTLNALGGKPPTPRRHEEGEDKAGKG